MRREYSAVDYQYRQALQVFVTLYKDLTSLERRKELDYLKDLRKQIRGITR